MILTSKNGLSPQNSATENSVALQKIIDCGGDIYVDECGTYLINDTIRIGSNTSIYFSNGTYVKREKNPLERVSLIKQ